MWEIVSNLPRVQLPVVVRFSTNTIMVSIPPRWIIVDDTSPDINYSGNSWFTQNGNPIGTEDTGLPYQNTLHGTITNASLAFEFTGRAITVKGTIQYQNVSSVDNPSWVCQVDGNQIGSDISRRPSTPTLSNDWIYCQSYRLRDGPHTLLLSATGTEKPFWFDRIEYAPSTSVPLEGKTISVSGADDAALHFSAGWSFGQTSQRGASMTFDFIGTMLTWWTQYVSNGNSTTATWSIDDKPAQNVTLPDHKAGSNLYGQKVFDSGTLAMGLHRLTVTYNGNSTNTPLVLGSIFIENGTFPSMTAGLPATTSRNNSTSMPTNSRTKVTPSIIGGVVGVVAFFLIIGAAFLFVFCRRRRRDSSRVRLIEKFDVSPGHPPHSDTSKPRLNFSNGDSSQLTSPGTSPGNILFPQPMPRKVRDELENYPGPGGESPSSSNAQIAQPQPDLYHQPMPRKVLENMAVARGGLEHSVNREVAPPHTGLTQGRIVVHQDSGVRLNNQVPRAFVDTPPEYN